MDILYADIDDSVGISGFKIQWLLSHDTFPILTMQFGPSEMRR